MPRRDGSLGAAGAVHKALHGALADATALQTAVDFEESERACGMEISKTVHRTSADM